jgi:hypothetical protein
LLIGAARQPEREESKAMQILESITEQIAATRLPLVGVTVAAVPCPDTPVILTLHWHGFRKEPAANAEPPQGPGMPVPSSALQVNERWSDLREVEHATLEAGWELGAWDVVRAQRAPCMRPGAKAAEAVDCLRAFGECPYSYRGVHLIVSEAPDREELIKLAAQCGYLYWQFRPVHGGIWHGAPDDATLHPDGTRTPHCPFEPAPVPAAAEGSERTVYRFGECAGTAGTGAS